MVQWRAWVVLVSLAWAPIGCDGGRARVEVDPTPGDAALDGRAGDQAVADAAPVGPPIDGSAPDGSPPDGSPVDARPADAAPPADAIPDAMPDAGPADARVVDAAPDAAPPVADDPRDVIVHLFEWPWDAVAHECEALLAPTGYRAVQVSPPQAYGLIEGSPWWERYQPVSYRIAGRSGDAAAFDDMVRRCAAVGVDVIVDAVLNHMAFAPGLGVDGTRFERYRYPGLYEPHHFHGCRRGIEDWSDRGEVQGCELATLPDLATELPHVRTQLAGYLQDLLDRGVAGFRVDAAKHMPAADLEAIFGALDGDPDVFQEVVDTHDAEVITAEEYFGLGRVTEFRYGLEITRVFTMGQLDWLPGFGEAWGLMPSDRAVVFIDNHDTQRGHGVGDPITFRDAGLYRVANAFMLAWPYGRPKVMSSYEFADGDQGPPRQPDGSLIRPRVEGQQGRGCRLGWVCEHRWPAIRAMVGFRRVTAGEPVVHWWSNGNDQIAFGRGDRGFIAINREEIPQATRTYRTGMPPGRYCNILADDCMWPITVREDGRADITTYPLSASAIHVEARAE